MQIDLSSKHALEHSMDGFARFMNQITHHSNVYIDMPNVAK